MAETQPETQTEAVDVGLRIVDVDELPAQYVNVLSANHDSESFQICFAQLMQPVVTGPDDVEEIKERGHVEAHAITRLILSPGMMERTIEVLKVQVDRRKQQLEAEGQAHGANRPH